MSTWGVDKGALKAKQLGKYNLPTLPVVLSVFSLRAGSKSMDLLNIM